MQFVPEAADLLGSEDTLKVLGQSLDDVVDKNDRGFASLTRTVFTKNSRLGLRIANVHYYQTTNLFYVNLRITVMHEQQFSSFAKSSIVHPDKPIKTITQQPESIWQGERVYHLRGFTHQEILDFVDTNFLKPLGSRDYNDCVVAHGSTPSTAGRAPVCHDCPYQLSCCS